MDFLDLHKAMVRDDCVITHITFIHDSKREGYKVEATVMPVKRFKNDFKPEIINVWLDEADK